MELLRHVDAILAEIGVENALHLSVRIDAGAIGSCKVMVAGDARWSHAYGPMEGHVRDPWLIYALHHSRPVPVHGLFPDDRDRLNLEFAAGNGINSILLAPIPVPQEISRRGMLLLGSCTEGYFEGPRLERLCLAARLLALALDDWQVSQWLRHFRETAKNLHDFDLAILRLVARDQTSKQIARALGTTVYTINSRLQRVTNETGIRLRKCLVSALVDCGMLHL